MFTFAQSVRRLSIGMLSVLILCLSYPVFAQNRASPDLALQDGSHQFIVKITQDRVESLKKKLNLQPNQMGGWNLWSSVLLLDVKKQRIEDVKSFESLREPQSDLATTNQKILQQEKRLQFHIDRMQTQLKRIEVARLNTDTFYQTLSKDQQTIFDLFWAGQIVSQNSVNLIY